VAYFDCTAALGDNCGALFHVVLPSVSLLASLARLHLRHVMVGVVGLHRSSGDSTPRRSAHHRNHCRLSDAVMGPLPYAGLSFVNAEAHMVYRMAYQTVAGNLVVGRQPVSSRVDLAYQTFFRS
jgi:hypothetical protein